MIRDGLVFKGSGYVSENTGIPEGYEKFSSYSYYRYEYSIWGSKKVDGFRVSGDYVATYLICTLFTFFPHALYLYVLFFIQRRRIKKNLLQINMNWLQISIDKF